jgi:hypothetical protein
MYALIVNAAPIADTQRKRSDEPNTFAGVGKAPYSVAESRTTGR